jgi:hypothetical protein
MIHTAKFYVMLEDSEVSALCRKFGKDISLLPNEIDSFFEGVSTNFRKNGLYWWMFIHIDFIKLLGKSNIQEKDLEDIQLKLNKFLYFIFGPNGKELTLLRLDFRLDVKIPNDKHREILLKLYKKTVEKYGFKRKNDHYKTTVYFNSKSVKVVVYDKETERNSKGLNVEEYEKDVLRFEVCLQNRHLNYMKRVYGLDKRLENYLNNTFWKKYISKNISPIFFAGDYYPINLATKIINQSNLKESDKIKLREFLCDVSRYGLDGITKLEKKVKGITKPKYSKYLIGKYITTLEGLNINPIPIPKHDAAKLGKEKCIKNPFISFLY